MEKYCPRCFKRFDTDGQVCPDDGTNLVNLEEGDLVGQELDNRYTIKGHVGKGGMGIVYRAEQHLIGRVVALKVLNKDVVKDETTVKRFLNEARVIASLGSEHTVTLYDFGVTQQGLLYYTMELLDGSPLSNIIRDGPPLEYPRACEIIFQTLESLGEAHDKGILHRDIKPDNLFIIKKGKSEAVKVLDFGIAKLVNEQGESNITKTGMICGTPQYLSPEQVLGNKPSPASDLYSLGIVLYEMLSGQPPFYSPTPMKLLMKHLNEIPPPVSVKNPDVSVPPSFNEFLEKSLQKDPHDRHASVEEFRLALRLAMERADTTEVTENIKGIATTSDGFRTLTADFDVNASGGSQTVVQETDPGATRARADGAIVDTSSGLRTLSGEDLEEATELVGGRRSRTGVLIGVGVAAAVLIAVLFAWKPWMGASPPGDKESAAAAENKAEKIATAENAAFAGDETVVSGAAQGPDVVEAVEVKAEALDAKSESEPDVAAAPPEDVKVALSVDVLADAGAPKPEVVAAPAQDIRTAKPDVAEAPAGEKVGGVGGAQAADDAAKKMAEKKRLERQRRKQRERKKKEEAARKKAEAAAAKKKAAEEKKKAAEAAKKKAAEAAKKKAAEEKKKEGGFKKIGVDPDKKDKKDDGKGFKKIIIK